VSLLALLDEYQEAVEFDLIALGLRLRNVGSEDFSWRDLLVVIRQSSPESALFRALNPKDFQWGLSELLLAEIADAANVANWQRGGGKRRDYPKPIPRPGVEPDEQKYGAKPIPIDEMAEWLGWT
jgi:hypothetical protein